ncbi:MAG: glutathione transferase GstA [Proteobacteria bacterium]|nr:glutathione transferase GstA [Pseudomonadota bacterium]
MKLYYSPGACSLSPHIALNEAGLDYELVRVDLKAKKTEGGEDYNAISPNGYIPLLELADGTRLAEGAAIVQYVADQAEGKALAPKWGSKERYVLMSWLNFISTELHKGTGPLRWDAAGDEVKTQVRERLAKRLGVVDKHLAEHGPWLLGKAFSVADGYLYNVMRWMPGLGVEMGGFAALADFKARMEQRESVQRALSEEGLT